MVRDFSSTLRKPSLVTGGQRESEKLFANPTKEGYKFDSFAKKLGWGRLRRWKLSNMKSNTSAVRENYWLSDVSYNFGRSQWNWRTNLSGQNIKAQHYQTTIPALFTTKPSS